MVLRSYLKEMLIQLNMIIQLHKSALPVFSNFSFF
jgi:hypothetical protein